MALLSPRPHSAANITCSILFVGRSGNLEFTLGKPQSGVSLRAGLLLRWFVLLILCDTIRHVLTTGNVGLDGS